MNKVMKHPEDFGPFLNRDLSDPECEEIRLHLEDCSQCRDEVATWRSMDTLFRGVQTEIEVPPFQWQRIAARLQAPAQMDLPARLLLLLRPWKVTLRVSLATLVFGAAILTALVYQKNNEERQLLSSVRQYAAALEQKTGAKKRMLGMQAGDIPASSADVSELASAIGFSPKTSIDEGVRRFVDWYLGYYGV